MVKVEINNRTRARIPAKQIRLLLASAQKALKIKTEQELSLAFVSSVEIRKLNRCCRGIDKVTDVLSFADDGKFSALNFIGEIVVCPAKAKIQAKDTVSSEILRLTLHGYLHLLGFDHKTKEDAKKMEEEEEKILKKINILRI